MPKIKIRSTIESAIWSELLEHSRESKRSVPSLLTEALREYLQRRRVRPTVLRHLEESADQNEELGKLFSD